MDAGRDRDGTIVDSTLVRDDASGDAIVAADGTGLDARTPPACGGSCDPRDPLACATGECVLQAGTPMCTPSAGAGLAGSTCAYPEDCAAGLACFADGAAGLGICAPLCCPRDATCAPTQRCGGSGELVRGGTTSWGRCVPVRGCDLAHPELACAAREGCYIVDSDGHTECLVAGVALEGEPCARSDDCAAGGVCAGIAGMSCARVCLLDTPRDCGVDRRCEAQAYSPPGTGICTPPPP